MQCATREHVLSLCPRPHGQRYAPIMLRDIGAMA